MTTDDELLVELKRVAAEVGHSPQSLISHGRLFAEWKYYATPSLTSPMPTRIDEAEISADILQNWPEWVADFAPAGSRWERFHWPDGSITIRLVTPRAYVLGARHWEIDDPRSSD